MAILCFNLADILVKPKNNINFLGVNHMSNLNIYQYLSNLDSLKSILTTLISIAVGSFTTYKVLNTVFQRENILFENLDRKLQMFDPPNQHDKDMNAELTEIKRNPLFKKVEPILIKGHNPNQITIVNNKSLVILGVGINFDYFEAVFNEAKRQRSPIIIYTYGDNQALKQNHWSLLNTYRWYSVSNTPLRLISDIFAILSTFVSENT
ncbi:MAG: hypothetical protein KME59_07080 [Trichormus sp. ATA11-4-KO1]|nr:hypothetical protein [Trichormus sp. ATA11-4-KO1]